MTDNLYPIYVASKGRPTSTTCKILKACSIPYTIVVEPHETNMYRKEAHHTIAELPLSEQGLWYVRQWIVDHAPKDQWFWMLDDDITAFYTVKNKRTVQVPPHVALLGAQNYFSRMDDVAQAGLEYQQFAWSQKRPYRLNTYCDVCVAIHPQRITGLRFKPDLALKVDRDFTLQVLASGYRTVCITRFAFAAPSNGSNAGGLADVYATAGHEAAESRQMSQYWPGICTPQHKPNGRYDIHIAWKQIAHA